MNLKINGEVKEVSEVATVNDLLKVEEVKMPEMVSVEVNGEIVDREDFDTFKINENDEVEFLYFMGGGAFGI